MRDERIGNDINIAWGIKSGDSPFSLEGKNVTLYLHHPYGKQRVEGFRLEGNKVIWTFRGVDQKYVGKHGLTLVVNEGANGMITTDSCDFVNLVACSCQVGGEDNDGVQTEAIELTSTLGFIAYDDTEIQNKLTELSAEVDELSERVDNLPTAESDVFKAIYGETTYEEIKAAYDSGKVVHCDYNTYCYVLARIEEGYGAYFSAVYSASVLNLICYASGSLWKAQSKVLEPIANKTTTINAESTDTQYPSAKAVYEALQNVDGGSDVFVAVYGTTTYAEAKAAHESGKVVICNHNGYVFVLTRILDSELSFVANNVGYIHLLYVTRYDVWWQNYADVRHELKTLDNGNAEITIAGKTAEVVTPQNVGKQGVIRQTQTWTRAADMGYDYVMSNLVRGAIPQANIDLFTSAGAIFNEESGYFELNGLTDISYEEMCSIYSAYMPNPWNNAQGMLLFNGIRTHIPAKNKIITFTPFNGLRLCYTCEELEVLHIIENGVPQFNNMQLALFNNYKLRKVRTYLNVSAITNFSQTFQNCFSLTYIRLNGLKVSADFSQSARLDYGSILHMIKNSAATSAIVITLHADVYARAMADTEITAALEAHPNVSLASA